MTSARTAPGPRPRATLRDVARAVGVSVATVSNAYNRPDQLSAELRGKVLAAARDLGYQGPDPLARSLRRGKTGVIGLVYDAPLDYAFADPAAALFLGSLSRTLHAEGLNLLLLSAAQDPAPVRSASVDGLILYCASEGSELLGAVLERGLPTVLVDQRAQPGAVRVGIDDAGGARAAAEHLRALGHRDIGVLCLALGPGRQGGPVTPQGERRATYYTTAERLRGYRLGLPGARLRLYECAQNTPEEGGAQALALLTAFPEVSALLCMSDVLAQGAAQAAQALGRRVPEDLSLIGYDDVPISAALNLTTIWQPTAKKGRRVAEALLAQLSGSPDPGQQSSDLQTPDFQTPDLQTPDFQTPDFQTPDFLPTRLVVRGSTAGKGAAGEEQRAGEQAAGK